MASRQQLFAAQFVTRAISRIAGNSNALLRRFGMNPGGRNIGFTRTRRSSYDIYNNTRALSPMTTPGQQSPTVRRTAVGSVAYTVAQFKAKKPFTYDELHNLRAVGANTTEVDSQGERLIAREQRQLARMFGNNRAAMLGGMLRGKMYVADADANQGTHYLSFDSVAGAFEMDFKMPAGNQGQLNMTFQDGTTSIYGGNIIDASWATGTTDIVDHCMKIDAAFQRAYGGRLELAVTNHSMWTKLINNDSIAAGAGTANSPFRLFVRGNEVNPENGMPNTEFEAVFTALPFIRWIITDEGVEIGAPNQEVFKPIIPDGYVWFGPDPAGPIGRDLMEMIEYGEPTSDGPNRAPVVRNGLYAYGVDLWDPARVELYAQDNAIPALYVPTATAFGEVVFT